MHQPLPSNIVHIDWDPDSLAQPYSLLDQVDKNRRGFLDARILLTSIEP